MYGTETNHQNLLFMPLPSVYDTLSSSLGSSDIFDSISNSCTKNTIVLLAWALGDAFLGIVGDS